MKRYLEAFLGVLVFINIALVGVCYIEYYNVQEIVYYELLIGILIVFLIQIFMSVIIKSRWKMLAVVMLAFLCEVALFIKGSEILGGILRFSEELHILHDKYYYSEVIKYTEFRGTLLFFTAIITLSIVTLAFNIKRNGLIYFNLFFAMMLWYQNGMEIVKKHLILFLMVNIVIYMMGKMIPILKDFKKDGEISLIVWMIVVAVLIGGCVRILPSKIYGNEFFGVHSFIDNEYAPIKGLDKISYRDVYRYSNANKDGKNKLGGKIKQHSKKIIEVKGRNVKYLKSSSKSSYDGQYWFNTSTSYKKVKNNVGINETLKDFEKKESEIIEIKYDNKFETKSVFSPGFSEEYLIKDVIYYDKNSTSILKEHEDIGKYQVKKIQLKSKKTGLILSEIFSEMPLESAGEFEYSIPVDIIKSENMTEEYKKKFMGAEEYREKNTMTQINNIIILEEYAKYLEVPSNITDRVYNLTYEVIEDATSPYEKINKIRAYLKNNYPYTLDVSEIPEGAEFVDYFLFEEKKGYCTYYATAMAIMGRIAGIPTRYCEGFKVDQTNSLYGNVNDRSDGGYFVKTDNAHAWIEVLVDPEDDVWIVVEATASEDSEDEDTEEITNENEEYEQRDAMNALNMDNINDKRQGYIDDIESNEKKSNQNFYILFKLLLIGILIKLLYDVFKRVSVMKSNSPSQMYYYALKRLKRVKIKKEISESEIEFSEKISNEDLRNIMIEIVRLGYEESYGIKNEYSSKAHYKEINRYVRGHLGIFKDTIIRVVLGE
ncbi:transglutaminase-like domain-containing protein [Oceanirhabdus seepicola]|uniref:Transglutaminase domain-containing protein n=1 Tax=Oceanirhabdus seepicola TaxID=2828781 RepID=A0A9J6P1J0_9CLOT|nr:transglutaminase-like domain-containing protein [Oceanirhabdus seepicola]MCM1990403.1 transglutaminase domain-containing protein [Oceanirhabdus seepicola]